MNMNMNMQLRSESTNQDMSPPGMNSCDVSQGSERLHKHYGLAIVMLHMIGKHCIGF